MIGCRVFIHHTYTGEKKNSVFGYHIEDKNLASVNYNHFGAPKIWYVVYTKKGKRKLEKLVAASYPQMKCKHILRHKFTLISPETLDKHKIPYKKV